MPPGRGGSASRVSTSGTAASAIGTFTQNTHCQPRPWVTAPPRTGPSTTATLVRLPYMPIARPRRCAGNAAFSRASAIGMMAAAPAPWTARAAISTPTLGASAHTADAAANRASPAAKTRRRPSMSPSAAPVSSSTAKLSV